MPTPTPGCNVVTPCLFGPPIPVQTPTPPPEITTVLTTVINNLQAAVAATPQTPAGLGAVTVTMPVYAPPVPAGPPLGSAFVTDPDLIQGSALPPAGKLDESLWQTGDKLCYPIGSVTHIQYIRTVPAAATCPTVLPGD